VDSKVEYRLQPAHVAGQKCEKEETKTNASKKTFNSAKVQDP